MGKITGCVALFTLMVCFIQPQEPGKIYLSVDQGKNWRRVDTGLPQHVTINDFVKANDTVFAVTDAHGVFVSTNHLESWYASNAGLPEEIKIDAITVFKNKIYLESNGQGIFVSDDGANHWHASNNGLKDLTVRVFHGFKSKLLAGTNHGIYISMDKGKSWSLSSPEYQINGITSVNNNIFMATNKGILVSYDLGSTWEIIYDKSAVHNIASNNSLIYAMTYGEGILRTTYGNMLSEYEWKKADDGLPNLYTFQVKGWENELFAGQWDGIYKSINKGERWEKSSRGLPDEKPFKELLITEFGIIAGAGMEKK